MTLGTFFQTKKLIFKQTENNAGVT